VLVDPFLASAQAHRTSAAAIEGAERWGQRVAIGTKQREVLATIVAPISVDMFDLNRDTSGVWMTLVPSAARTFFSKFVNEIAPQQSRVYIEWIFSGFDERDVGLEAKRTGTTQRAESRLRKCNATTAFVCA
jgi:hypothetical protein